MECDVFTLNLELKTFQQLVDGMDIHVPILVMFASGFTHHKLRIYDVRGQVLADREIRVYSDEEEYFSLTRKGIYVYQVMVNGDM